jgi:hypothetical protein
MSNHDEEMRDGDETTDEDLDDAYDASDSDEYVDKSVALRFKKEYTQAQTGEQRSQGGPKPKPVEKVAGKSERPKRRAAKEALGSKGKSKPPVANPLPARSRRLREVCPLVQSTSFVTVLTDDFEGRRRRGYSDSIK